MQCYIVHSYIDITFSQRITSIQIQILHVIHHITIYCQRIHMTISYSAGCGYGSKMYWNIPFLCTVSNLLPNFSSDLMLSETEYK